MKTLVIGQKDFRKNISQFSKKIREKKITYIITYRNKPVLEVHPIDEMQKEYYSHLDNTMDFWNTNDDDSLFIRTS